MYLNKHLHTFKYNSDAYNKYGSFLIVVFLYTQHEREELDKMIPNQPFSKHGRIKARYLGHDLPKEKVELLSTEGINSEDITKLSYYNAPSKNTFHSKEKRELNKIEIPVRTQRKGGDLDWMFGFSKRLNEDGVGLSPRERRFYLAGKLYYEKENITKEEKKEIFNKAGNLKEGIEWEYLQIKYIREEIRDDEKQRLEELDSQKNLNSFHILDKYLIESGSSIKLLAKKNTEQVADLLLKVLNFKERRINVTGKYPIYIDRDGYLHVYMRHVEEFQVNKHFEHKDNFLWKEEDIFSVMEHVIVQVESEYQAYRSKKTKQKYSKYGRQSIYFQGDYYTLHIEPNGRISTFYKNRKEHEKTVD